MSRVSRGAWPAVLLSALLLAVGAPAAAAPGPPAYPEFWFDQWGVSSLWAKGIRGDGITVAVIDTGVQASVTELSGSVLSGTDLTGLGGDGRIDRAQDGFSHGTAMASLIVARGGDGYVNGVAPDAKILPVAVPLEDSDSARPDTDETADAIRYAADHGARIINMAFGQPRTPSRDNVPCPARTQSAVFYALRRGAVLVAAGGNSGEQGSPVDDPSVCLGVISVGAVDAEDEHASFSSDHPYLTVSAPGVGVTSLNRDGEVFVGAGTSQASALTSGALALIWSAHPSETNRQITARLMAGLRDIGPRGRDSQFGFGIVDADASVDADIGPSTPNPVYAAADPFLNQLAGTPQKLSPPPAAETTPVGGYRRLSPATGFDRWTIIGATAAGAALVVLVALIASRILCNFVRSPHGSTQNRGG